MFALGEKFGSLLSVGRWCEDGELTCVGGLDPVQLELGGEGSLTCTPCERLLPAVWGGWWGFLGPRSHQKPAREDPKARPGLSRGAPLMPARAWNRVCHVARTCRWSVFFLRNVHSWHHSNVGIAHQVPGAKSGQKYEPASKMCRIHADCTCRSVGSSG